jgi:hypothetical protein
MTSGGPPHRARNGHVLNELTRGAERLRAGAGEDPAACRVGSEGLKQRGRQPIRRRVRVGSPALQLRALQIRSSGQVVQDRPVVSALWTDVPGLSSRADSRLRPWQQCWQQLEHLLARVVAATGGPVAAQL